MSVLGVLPPLGGGLRDLTEAGQLGRLFDAYIPAWLTAFDRVEFFSCLDETIEEFTADPEQLRRVRVRPRPWRRNRRAWALRMPFHHGAAMRRCSVFRVLQITGAIPAIAARRMWGVPFVTTYGYRYAEFARVAERRRFKALALSLVERAGLSTADAVIATTPSLAAATGRRCAIIPNGVDTTRFAPSTRARGRRLLFVGRLEPQKNLDRLIDAVARIPDARLTIVGDGSLRRSLQARGGADLLGAVEHRDLPRIYAEADAFVFPSLIEGHPKALLEAAACGLPCVASNREGCKDVIEHERTGLLCDPMSVDDIARQIRRVLDDAGLAARLGAAARERAVREFDLSALLKREVALLRSVARMD